MKTLMIGAIAALTTAVVFAEATPAAAPAAAPAKVAAAAKDAQRPKMNPRQAWMKATGGRIIKPNSAKGKVVFLDTANLLPKEDYDKVLKQLEKDNLRYDYSLVKDTGSDFTALKAKHGASILVAFYADEKAPTMTAAPEDGWAAINVPKLSVGLDTDAAKAKFGPSRLRKEMMRAFAYACGCGGTGFPGNTLNVATVQALDYVDEFIPNDALQNILKLSKERGMTPSVMTTYNRACQEGWAPAPTNDIQKAVWDKVHTLPQNPIKIEYDPKKGR